MDAKTIDAYNQMAQQYDDETANFWERFPRTFLDEFARLTKGTVLNIGSGPGRDGLLLQERGLDVLCFDASVTMANICTAKGLKAVVGDFNTLPFDNDAFDGVWAYTSLLHVPKTEIHIPLQEIKRVLKTNSFFGLGLIEGEGETYKANEKIPLPRLFSYYQKTEIENILHNLDFDIVYTEEFKPGKHWYLNLIAQNRK
jgi:SAM-dependent methyltransferase